MESTGGTTTQSYPDGQFQAHVYGLRYRYDLNGRRTALLYPDGLAPAGTDSVAYTYHDWGALHRVTGLEGETYTFAYDASGRRESLTYPGGRLEEYGYYPDGRLHTRNLDTLFADTLTYDPRGKVIQADLAEHSFQHWYSGLGQVVAARWQRKYQTDYQVDEFRADALGNKYWSRKRDPLGAEPIYDHNYSAVGRLAQIEFRGLVEGTNVFREYDAAGNTSQATEIPHNESDGEVQRRWSRHYYDAAERLRATRRFARERYVGTVGNDDLVQEYRYDAVGRRVIVHARHEPYCEENCHSAITRSIWDGNRLLYELRGRGESGARRLNPKR